MHLLVRKFIRDDSGQDLLEYGLLAALIACVVFAAVTNAGTSIATFWTGVASSLAAVA
jgi:Flp pilus assembly pilin Flp